MEGPGTMSWEEFLENVDSFVRVSDEISDGWELRGEKSIPGQAYLYRRFKTFVPNDYLADVASTTKEKDAGRPKGETEDEDANGDNETFVIDDPYEASAETERPFVTEHHVLWHMSYGVPVIYFNGWFSDFPGINGVTVTRVQNAIGKDALGYGELSQAIHPILGTTFLHLHPCKSQEWLSNMWQSSNKLVSWLSVVSPVALNLRLSPRYYALTGIENTKRETRSSAVNDEDELDS